MTDKVKLYPPKNPIKPDAKLPLFAVTVVLLTAALMIGIELIQFLVDNIKF